MAPKTKATATTADGSAKGKGPSTSGTATPVSSTVDKDTSEHFAAFAGGKPDKKLYDAEQNKLKSEIDALQLQLSAARDKIAFATKSGPGNDRKNALHAELDSIRDKQSSNKNSRDKLKDQIAALNEGIAKKVKDLNTSKAKTPFKNVADIDAHIKYGNLEKGVESGNMKLAEEKRALQDISTAKRSRRTIEGFQKDQESIDVDRQKVEELNKEYNDPASQAISERYNTIKAELDALKKESNEAYANRNKLFEERDKIQKQLNVLRDEKRESAQQFREANDRYYTKLNEDRARRAERARAQRAADEAAKKKEIAERLLEEAQVPAFQSQIEDCQTLIDYFSGKTTTATLSSVSLLPKTEVVGVPKLEIRQVEAAPEGAIIRKKKGEDEDAYFVAKPKGKANKKTSRPNGSTPAGETSPSPTVPASLHVPLATLSALLSLSIPPPASNSDVPRLVEDLNTKKAWFEANQTRVTADNIAKAQAEIARLNKSETPSEEPTPPNGAIEPTPTPQIGEVPVEPVSSEAVDDKLEAVQEAEAVEVSS
ncbi:hypothetical protein BDN70DRAFT_890240 [Pholiota conissans]|uniref:Nuclear segregation protein Bfr1 n=1 Tax=Pholiota conissans TaxID=109636 RepID=A0A9P6D754_9AGAR|nr:hypothetical protein BDN70DRAFT_890240 [Pholiota conissans]